MDIAIHCAYDELIDVAALIPNPRNPNTHPQRQIELLAKIIKNQGWRSPITVSNRSGFIVRGHGRLLAAQHLGLEKAPVDRQDYGSDADEWADLIADNRIAELSSIDDAVLGELMSEIHEIGFDMDLTGFSEKQVDNLLADLRVIEVKEDDFDVVAAVKGITEPITKLGDIWQLGAHRLMCGDATKLTDVEKLMNGDLADVIFTDPPYNVAYEGGTKDKLTIQNDNMSSEAFNQFLHAAFSSMYDVAKQGTAIYVCHADSEGSNFRGSMQASGWMYKQCLIWAKNQFVLGRQDYQWQHEPILYGWKPGAAHRFYGGRKQGTLIEETAPLTIKEDDQGALLTFSDGVRFVTVRVPAYEMLQAGEDSLSTVWRFDKPLRNGDHPTTKPIGLCARAIQNSSKSGETVVDFFGGSGSTLMAAEQTGRVARVMEIDPVYCDVIIRRWEDFTGKKGAKVDQEESATL
ncbi:MAG: site-specific DNA-methyltransferase [Sporomusaceae bacterium]|nr:site-specific DNA-methyltransferase [Sporomusaceae bacterium]